MCSELQLGLSAGRHNARRLGRRSSGGEGFFLILMLPACFEPFLGMSIELGVKIWTLSWNLCEDKFRNGYGGLLPSLLGDGWGASLSSSLLQEWALGERSFDGHILPAAVRAAQTFLYTSLWMNITCSAFYCILIIQPEFLSLPVYRELFVHCHSSELI